MFDQVHISADEFEATGSGGSPRCRGKQVSTPPYSSGTALAASNET
jgi:hypothetical protein